MAGLSFANLIAAGVFEGLDGVRGQAGWRWYDEVSIIPLETCIQNHLTEG
jgi:hypothetical protein